jgi:hypothetical protein
MKFVKVDGQKIKAGERHILTLLDRNKFPTEPFLRLLNAKVLEVNRRPTRRNE